MRVHALRPTFGLWLILLLTSFTPLFSTETETAPRDTLPAEVYAQLDQALARFSDTRDQESRDETIASILALAEGHDETLIFDAVIERLRQRRFAADVVKGRKLLTREGQFHYTLLVPKSYDPQRSYPVRVYLHGGVNRAPSRRDGSWWSRDGRLAHPDRIAIIPTAWNTAQWWERNQAENIEALLREVRRTYNTDENRVALFGISDGGSGAYFYGFRAATPWAAFVPFIGHPAVLAHPSVGTDGQLYVANLVNRPIYAINGGIDRLYPTSSVRPYIELFRRAGGEVELIDKKDSGHSVSWWPEEAAGIEAFLEAHPRDPLPDRLSWETETTERYNRFSWLVIERLGPTPSDQPIADPNTLGSQTSSQSRAFPRRLASGRVDAERRGNQIVLETRGVEQLALLLSPDEIDLSKPVRVITNGEESFYGKIAPDLRTLLEWAAHDVDRHMLFAARLDITPGG